MIKLEKETGMNVPFLDLRVLDDLEREGLLRAIKRVLQHGRILLGPEVKELEDRIAGYIGRSYAVGVNSGTDALFLGLRSAGIGQGDEVITTSLSWIATANAIAMTGAVPVFSDIGDDLNMDPASIRRLITSRTKAILPVHYTGKICNMREIMSIAEEHGLLIIEDASQAFGAEYYGQRSGSFGHIACFSMNPMKIFAACGEAGMVLTDSDTVFEKLISLRYNGTVNREVCMEPALNARLDTMQAAVLLERYRYVERIIERRREIAEFYNRELEGVVSVPREREGERDVFYTYTVRTERRDELKAYLEHRGIETKIQHPLLMPEQPAYRTQANGDFFNALKRVKEILCLPANEKLAPDDIAYVAKRVKEFYRVRS